MRKIIPFRATDKRRLKRRRITEDQSPPALQAEEEEGMVTVLLQDGTAKTITGSNLELDIAYQDGVPYLVVRERR